MVRGHASREGSSAAFEHLAAETAVMDGVYACSLFMLFETSVPFSEQTDSYSYFFLV